LGEGDVGAGANPLAAMTCSLANVQRPGSGLVNGNGDTIGVGASFLVSGARSVSLISDKVLAGLATRQNNLVSDLTQETASDEVEAKKSTWPMDHSPADFMADLQASMLATLYRPFPGIGPAGSAGSWSRLVETPPLPTFDDLAANPMVFVTGCTPASLTQQSEHYHPGRPFVDVGVGSADNVVSSCAAFTYLCLSAGSDQSRRRIRNISIPPQFALDLIPVVPSEPHPGSVASTNLTERLERLAGFGPSHAACKTS
jgi:hypothetical protein